MRVVDKRYVLNCSLVRYNRRNVILMIEPTADIAIYCCDSPV